MPAEGQSVLIVTQVVQHGNLSSGNVPHDDDGFFLSVSVLQATGQSGPSFFFFLMKHRDTAKPTSHGKRHSHPNFGR